VTLEETRAALVKAQLEVGKRFRIWKRQPNPTTHGQYRKANNALGDAITAWADAKEKKDERA
jgi:phosphoenolpyruvate carboxylase